MSNLQDDIIKYKNGELTAKEMHALEKKALSDPFLADALEGVENISSHELANDVAELDRRIVKQKKSVLFTPLRIAAGIILIAVTVVGLYQLTPETKTIALKNEKPNKPVPETKKEPSVEAAKEEAAETKKIEAKKATEKANVIKADRENEKLHETMRDKNVATENAQPKIERTKGEEEKQTEVVAQNLSALEQKPNEVKEDTKEAPVSIAMQPAKQLAADEDAKKENASPRARKFATKSQAPSGVAEGASQVNPKRITGKVTSAEDGAPLPGVNVAVYGTTQGTVTDAQGNFSLQSVNENRKLIFSFIGMETQELSIEGKDKVDATLKQDVSQLSEVVVAGYGVKKDDDAEPIVHLATPVGGMRAYNKYLDKNVRYPQEALKDNIKGKVKVEFSVKTDGSLDDYKVVKSLGHGCDEEVIRLIKDGPKWSPTTENGQPVESTVLIGVKFDPAKAGK